MKAAAIATGLIAGIVAFFNLEFLVIDFLNAKFGFMTSMKIVAAFFIAIIWLGAFWRIRKCIGPERKQP